MCLFVHHEKENAIKKEDMLSFLKKNYLTVVIGVFVVAALLLAAEMFTEKTEDDQNSVLSYKSALEERLSVFLRKMNGVGECEVFITLEGSDENVDGMGTAVRGIAVLCSGGGNSKVKSEITELLCRVFGISQTKISVGNLN